MRHSRGKREPSPKPERVEGEKDTGDGVYGGETEEDGEGVDASPLLSCPVEGCIPTYQKHHNLERHLLFGKRKLVSEKYTTLDTARLAYDERVQRRASLLSQHWLPRLPLKFLQNLPWCKAGLLKVRGRQPVFNEDQLQYLYNKFQIGQESGHKADPELEKMSRDMRYARRDNSERRFYVEKFLTAQQIQSYVSRSATKLRPAVTAQSGNDYIDDNDSQAAQEQEAYLSARLAVLRQRELLHPIVYDTLNICSLYSTNKLTKLSVAQLMPTCSYYKMDREKSALHYFYR